MTFSRKLNEVKAVATKVASGRATKISTAESARPLAAMPPRSSGKTSSPSRMKRPIWDTQPSPSWKETTLRLAGIRAEPSASAVR